VRKRAIAWARRVWDKVILAPLRAGELVEIRRCLTTAPLDTNLREQRRISTISRKRICLFPGVSEHRRTTANLSRRPRMADDTSSSLVGSTSFFLLFAGKNLRESCRSRTLLVACAATQPALRRERGSYTGHHHGPHRRVCLGLGVRMPSAPPAETFLSTSAVHNHPPPQHIVSSRAARRPSVALYAHLRWRSMQDPASELRRIPLPRTRVNNAVRRTLRGVE